MVSVYEALSLMIGFGTLIVAVIAVVISLNNFIKSQENV
ncbi:putative holin-like toxin [Ferdinandcohnia sp. SAFN-114]